MMMILIKKEDAKLNERLSRKGQCERLSLNKETPRGYPDGRFLGISSMIKPEEQKMGQSRSLEKQVILAGSNLDSFWADSMKFLLLIVGTNKGGRNEE